MHDFHKMWKSVYYRTPVLEPRSERKRNTDHFAGQRQSRFVGHHLVV